MKKSRYTEEQIIGILKQHEAGVKTADLCREHGISAATFYGWKSKYGGMEVSEAQRLRAMEDENRRLKLLVAELSLHGEALKAVIRKNGWSCCRADPMLPAEIRRLHPRLMLLQDPDDLLFRVSALLHPTSSRLHYERTPTSTGGVFREQVTCPPPRVCEAASCTVFAGLCHT